MTKDHNIRKNVVVNVAAFFLNIAITFLGYKIVISQDGLESLGLWSALNSAILILKMGDIGMGSATERQVAQLDVRTQADQLRNIIDTSLILNLAVFIVIGLCGYLAITAFAEYFIDYDDKNNKIAFAVIPIIIATFILSNSLSVALSALRGLHLSYISAIITTFSSIIGLAVIILLVPKFGIVGLAYAQLIQSIISPLIAWVIICRHIFVSANTTVSVMPFHFKCDVIRHIVSFSLRSQAVNLINGLLEPVSKLLISYLGGLGALGVYEVSYKVVSLTRNAIIAGVHSTTAAMSSLIMSNKEQAINLYRRSYKLTMKSTALTLASISVCSPILSIIIIGHVDAMFVSCVIITSAGYFGNVLGAPAYVAGFASGRLKYNMISATISLLFLVLASLAASGLKSDLSVPVSMAISLAIGGIIIKYYNERYVFEMHM